MRFLLALCAMTVAALAAETPEASKPLMRVSLSVTGNDKITGQTRSFLSRELRKLPDIELTNTQPAFRIVCVVTEITSKGEPLINVMAVTTSTMVRLYAADIELAKKLTSEEIQKFHAILGPNGTLEGSSLVTEAPEKWEESCKSVVAAIDGEILEKARTFARELKEKGKPKDLRK